MKKINNPVLKSAKQLTPSEMNNIHFSDHRTILTPEVLAHATAKASGDGTTVRSVAGGSPASGLDITLN